MYEVDGVSSILTGAMVSGVAALEIAAFQLAQTRQPACGAAYRDTRLTQARTAFHSQTNATSV